MAYDYASTGEVSSITQLLTGAVSTYGYADTAHPNAASAVTTVTPVEDDPETLEIDESLTPVTSSDAFTYDDAGRMVSRAIAGQAATALSWDASSNLVATSGQGGDRVYLYDASGQRVAQVSVGDVDAPTPVSATVYFGATEATDPNTASGSPDDVSATRFYALGGSTVATATADTGSAPLWALLFGDIQGSASVSMELVADTGVASGFEPASITHEVVRDAYTPYGAARGDGTDDLAIDRGWLGQYEDSDTGLTYLNARYYDPILGRFLSPDPLMDPGDPRTLDPYRYADNNPIVYTDPTGLCPGCSIAQMQLYGAQTSNNLKNIAPATKATLQQQTAYSAAKTNSTSGGKPKQAAAPPPAQCVVTPTQTWGQAFVQGASGGGGAGSVIAGAGYAQSVGVSGADRASLAGTNLAYQRWYPGTLKPGVLSSSGTTLAQAGRGGWGGWNTVGKSPFVRGAGPVLGGANIIYGTYDAYETSIENGEGTEIATERAHVAAAATTTSTVGGILMASMITGAVGGSVAPGVGTLLGLAGGLIVGLIIYASVSSAGNGYIDRRYY